MNAEIIGLTDWLKTPPGAYLLDWERVRFDEAVSDVFGYHALQLGLPQLDALQANRMPHKWLALPDGSARSVRPPCLFRKTAWTWWYYRTPWSLAATRIRRCARSSASWCRKDALSSAASIP